jgi:hypothetical protein
MIFLKAYPGLKRKKLIDIGLRCGFQWNWKSGFGRFLPHLREGDQGHWMFEGLILGQST